MRRLLRSEDGATVVLVAAAMLMLLSVLAWALDGGRAYDERRDTQSAADMAALAAAFAGPDCENQDWLLAGQEAAAENGFDNDGVTNTVTVTNLDASGGYGPYLAEVESLQENAFGPAIGMDTLTVTSQAQADCVRQSGLGGYAVFASATACPPNELKIDASGMTIDGGVHSNDDLLLTAAAANPGAVDGNITWVGSETISNVTTIAPGTAYQWDAAALGYPPTPGGWNIDAYRPLSGPVPPLGGGSNTGNANYHYYATDVTLSGTLLDGLYFVDGELTLDSMTVSTATFVATGQIKLQGSTNTLLAPFDLTGLGLYSDAPGVPDCTGGDIAIQWSGSNHVWSGVQYAPNGRVVMSGATSSSFNGSIIAYRIDLSGSDISITYDSSFTGIPITSLRLEQ